jgi:hypothetical protein
MSNILEPRRGDMSPATYRSYGAKTHLYLFPSTDISPLRGFPIKYPVLFYSTFEKINDEQLPPKPNELLIT